MTRIEFLNKWNLVLVAKAPWQESVFPKHLGYAVWCGLYLLTGKEKRSILYDYVNLDCELEDDITLALAHRLGIRKMDVVSEF